MSVHGFGRLAAVAAALIVLGVIVAPSDTTAPAAAFAAGHPGPTPTTFTMDPTSATFDVRTLPPLPASANVDRIPERDEPRTQLSPAGDLAAVGSGVGPSAAPAPSPSSSFEGLAFNDDCGGSRCGAGHPPDTNGDVGPTYYIETVNTAIGIYNKSTGSRVAAFTFDALMSQGHFGNLCDTDNFGDPVVVYDTFANRWIITDFAFTLDSNGNVLNPPGSYQCFAVSKSGDPVSGGWYFYSIHLTDGLQDYPKFGIWPDGLYMSANMFGFGASGSFQNVRVWALNRAQMEAGQVAQVVQFNAVSKTGPCSVFTLLPSNARLQTGIPPVGRENLFASVWCYTARVRIWKFHVDWANTANSTFLGPSDSTASTTWAAPPNSVPEKDGNSLDTLAMRLMVQNQYTNINGVESLWDSHTVAGSSSSQAAVRYYQVPVTGGMIGAPIQAATYNPDSRNRWLPSVAVDRAGDMAIGYSVADGSIHPAIRYAGRLHGDAANTITQTETSLIEGAGAQVGDCGGSACTRWGDYSAMTLDPDGCTFWYTNEYYADLSLNDHTRIGSFTFPSCASSPPPPSPTPVPSPTSTPTSTPTPTATNTPSPTPTPIPTPTPPPPSVTTFAPTTSSPSNASTISYSLVFNTSITGLSSTDFSASGTAASGGTPCAVSPSASSGTSFTVSVTGCVDGSLTLQLNASTVTAGGAPGPVSAAVAATVTIDRTAPALTTPGLSATSVIPGASVTVTATATDAVAVASAQRSVGGGTWTAMTAADGSFGGTSEDVTATFTAPSTAGSYQVCVRATDSAGNNSTGTACATLTVMTFSLSSSPTSQSVRQGFGTSYTISISRSSFTAPISFSVGGLPAGATASFSPNPASSSSTVLSITTSNCGTVTPIGTRTLTVSGSASGLTKTVSVSLSVTDGPPKVTGPTSTLYSNSTLGSTTVPVKTAWSACDPDGIASYTLQRQVSGGSWTAVSLSSATATSITQWLSRTTSYRYRLRAKDKLGNYSAYSYTPTFEPLISDQTSSAVTYSGTWATGTSTSYWGGTTRYATAAGASATYTFTGESVGWVAYRGPNRGSAAVYIDGVYRTTVSLYSSTSSARRIVFTTNWGVNASHTIKIVVLGTAGHPRVDVDAFVRLYRLS